MKQIEDLRKLMKKYSLTRNELSKMLYVGQSTVDSWLNPNEKNHRRMPKGLMELLKYRLREK